MDETNRTLGKANQSSHGEAFDQAVYERLIVNIGLYSSDPQVARAWYCVVMSSILTFFIARIRHTPAPLLSGNCDFS